MDRLAGFQDTRLGNNICFFPQSFVQTVCQHGGLLVNTWACTPNSCGNTKLRKATPKPGITALFGLFATNSYVHLHFYLFPATVKHHQKCWSDESKEKSMRRLLLFPDFVQSFTSASIVRRPLLVQCRSSHFRYNTPTQSCIFH